MLPYNCPVVLASTSSGDRGHIVPQLSVVLLRVSSYDNKTVKLLRLPECVTVPNEVVWAEALASCCGGKFPRRRLASVSVSRRTSPKFRLKELQSSGKSWSKVEYCLHEDSTKPAQTLGRAGGRLEPVANAEPLCLLWLRHVLRQQQPRSTTSSPVCSCKAVSLTFR